MSDEDIELAAEWAGEEGQFVEALAAVRFLDGLDGAYTLHDWHEHNPWAAGADMRSAKARWNAAKRHHGAAEADRLVPEYAASRNASSTAAADATSMLPACTQQGSSNAPSPSPSPSPSPTPTSIPEAKASSPASPPSDLQPVLDGMEPGEPGDEESKAEKVPPCPYDQLLDAYAKALPMLPQPRRSLFRDGKNAAAARQRWAWVLTAKHESGERAGQRLATTVQEGVAWFARYFDYVGQSAFLNGASGRFSNCEIGWLLNAANFEKVLTGKYHGEQRKAAHA